MTTSNEATLSKGSIHYEHKRNNNTVMMKKREKKIFMKKRIEK